MHNLIYIISRDSGLGGGGSNVEHLTREAADLAHTLLLCLVEDGDLVPSNKDLFGSRNAIFRVIGSRDVCWYFTARRQRVRRPQRSGIRESRERVVLAGGCIWFRNNIWRKEFAERITRRFVRLLVLALSRHGIRNHIFTLMPHIGTGGLTDIPSYA